jgi:hypothetical protein
VRSLSERISPAYLAQQRELHARPEGYGGKGSKWAVTVEALIRQYGATSVCDYACGEGTLIRELKKRPLGGVRFENYDPAVPEFSAPPSFADLVCATDMLEHVEPHKLDAVLDHIHMLTRKAAFLVVALVPANKILSDGRNAHLILESSGWWWDRLERAGFKLSTSEGLPFHPKYRPGVQSKRLIVIGEPV